MKLTDKTLFGEGDGFRCEGCITNTAKDITPETNLLTTSKEVFLCRPTAALSLMQTFRFYSLGFYY